MFFYICLLKSTALYGCISLIFYRLIKQIPVSELISIALRPTNVQETFIAYIVWSVPAYIILFAIHSILVVINHKRYPKQIQERFDPLIKSMGSWIISDITNPFRGLMAFFTLKNCYDRNLIDCKGWALIDVWGTTIIHFLWSVLLFGWIIFGFIKT